MSAFLFHLKSIARAETTYYLITEEISPYLISSRGITFFDKTFIINYTSGDVWLSSTPNGTGNILVDDVLDVFITNPNGTLSLLFGKNFSNGCTELRSYPPQNIKNGLSIGENKLTVRLSDRCGTGVSSTALYLKFEQIQPTPSATPTPLPTPTPTPAVTPFLRLPWDYEKEGLTFNEAALNMSSYFDHEYPLLSANSILYLDPSETVTFSSPQKTDESYSSHDGYDYAKQAKALLNKPILAAADGIATYLGTCGPCGNAILIDHGNGFQTRYYHMQKEGLITSDPNQKVPVTKGQQIGKIGATGNVIPRGDEGAHIHFMVVQDKNKDGNFNDNIPDGLVDPYGWQSKEPDPWENFTFTLNNVEKTGSKSYYLWDKPLDNLDATLDSNGGVFNTQRFELKFPQNFTQQNLQLEMKAEPRVETADGLRSIGSTIKTTLKDASGNLASQFEALYELTIDYRNQRDGDMLTIDPTTLKIYSSNDGETWVEEPTFFDFVNFKANTKLNHMTHFALMGKRLDTIPPTTNVILEGEQGKQNWYRSVVKVNLNAIDNENGLGVDYTIFKVNNEDWQQYTSPLNLSSEGNYTIEFYSVDQDENIEEVKKVEFSIDKTPPEAKIYANQEILDMTIEGVDQNATSVEVTQPNVNNLQNIIINDLAENKISLLAKFNNKDKKDDLTIYRITYNNQLPIEQPYNKFMLLFNPFKDKIKTEKQYLELSDKKVNLQYDFDKDITRVTTDINGTLQTESYPGFKLLQVQTNKGTLEYSY